MTKTKGSALLTALLMMTLIAIIATAQSHRLMIEIYRTRLISESTSLYETAQLGIFWAMDALKKPSKELNHASKNGLILTMPSQKNLPNNIKLISKVYDLQARLNLNNLVNKKWGPVFQKFYRLTLPNSSISQAIQFVKAISYWISPYRPDAGQDTFLKYYSSKSPGLLPGYQTLKSESELRLIQGMDAQKFQMILPYITVLPEMTKINLNTAPASLILALSSKKKNNMEILKLFMKVRKREPIEKMALLKPMLDQLKIQQDFVTLESQYYLVISQATLNDLNMTVLSVLHRTTKNKKKKIKVHLIRESINTL